ncbi:hypothetical protein BBD41_13020 [Paenibacillus ihbetae]|uniref:Uncharacterized protein n=1 Tax=Paenibacillus ihbetae TaxID=1870820 RepID=A0A1B2E0I0_9BACL|nr:hypothetical protein [Paenibacillus ihbetae]ANY73432.1 hypothetical protein BBD41_13020 [Paenibacillus ihbetae]
MITLIGAAIPSLIVSLVAVYALTVVFRRKSLHLLLLGIQSTLFGIGLFLLYHISANGGRQHCAARSVSHDLRLRS